MKITREQMWDIVRATEWLYDENEKPNSRANKRAIKLHELLKDFYRHTPTEPYYELK